MYNLISFKNKRKTIDPMSKLFSKEDKLMNKSSKQ